MAQSDQTVQNATFPAVRADINDNLAALYSQSSGNSAPTTTVAFQPWVDTSSSPPVYKIRNATNSGWITIGVLDTNFEVGGITPIANGGTGETTASAAINALVPSQTGNAGKFLGTDGTALSWLVAASGASVQVFTSSGTYTPTASKTSYLVFAVGGGGGGGFGSFDTSASNTRYGVGAGGGSGGCAFRIYNNTELGTSATVTIGAGGGSQSNGGSTSFNPGGTGSTITGAGGSRGGDSNTGAGSGGAGGGVTNSLITMTGNTGGVGNINDIYHSGGNYYLDRTGGTGAASVFWGAGRGGNGGYTGSNATAGQAGIVVVLEF
jgi:hypothetical protein